MTTKNKQKNEQIGIGTKLLNKSEDPSESSPRITEYKEKLDRTIDEP